MWTTTGSITRRSSRCRYGAKGPFVSHLPVHEHNQDSVVLRASLILSPTLVPLLLSSTSPPENVPFCSGGRLCQMWYIRHLIIGFVIKCFCLVDRKGHSISLIRLKIQYPNPFTFFLFPCWPNCCRWMQQSALLSLTAYSTHIRFSFVRAFRCLFISLVFALLIVSRCHSLSLFPSFLSLLTKAKRTREREHDVVGETLPRGGSVPAYQAVAAWASRCRQRQYYIVEMLKERPGIIISST